MAGSRFTMEWICYLFHRMVKMTYILVQLFTTSWGMVNIFYDCSTLHNLWGMVNIFYMVQLFTTYGEWLISSIWFNSSQLINGYNGLFIVSLYGRGCYSLGILVWAGLLYWCFNFLAWILAGQENGWKLCMGSAHLWLIWFFREISQWLFPLFKQDWLD